MLNLLVLLEVKKVNVCKYHIPLLKDFGKVQKLTDLGLSILLFSKGIGNVFVCFNVRTVLSKGDDGYVTELISRVGVLKLFKRCHGQDMSVI